MESKRVREAWMVSVSIHGCVKSFVNRYGAKIREFKVEKSG